MTFRCLFLCVVHTLSVLLKCIICVWLPHLQLSRYCDDLLRNHAKGFSETEIDDRLNQVIVLFKYIDDRDLFERVGVCLNDSRFFLLFA